jgi:long-subunit acyl-CoA synthetase (AMP-forming)
MARIQLDPVTTLVDVVTSFQSKSSQESIHFYNGYRVFRYTYGELYTLCLRCAALLTRQGLLKGDKILIWAPNSPEWIILQCACALNGVISVPLDIRNDPTFIGKIQHEVEAKCIFRTQYKQDPGLTIPTVYMESLLDLIDACPADKPTVPVSPEDWMSIFYTSGTTGRPKGVTTLIHSLTLSPWIKPTTCSLYFRSATLSSRHAVSGRLCMAGRRYCT